MVDEILHLAPMAPSTMGGGQKHPPHSSSQRQPHPVQQPLRPLQLDRQALQPGDVVAVVTHSKREVSFTGVRHVCPAAHTPQTPPHPLAPQVRFAQRGVHAPSQVRATDVWHSTPYAPVPKTTDKGSP